MTRCRMNLRQVKKRDFGNRVPAQLTLAGQMQDAEEQMDLQF